MTTAEYTPPFVSDFLLHLNSSSEFTERGLGRQLRALGGTAHPCRGYQTVRFAIVPNTPEGRAWAANAIALFGGYKGTFVMVNPTGGSNGAVSRSTTVAKTAVPSHAAHDLDALFARFEAAERAWWETTGRKRAEAVRARKVAEAPADVTRFIREALALGCSATTLREAVEAALASA